MKLLAVLSICLIVGLTSAGCRDGKDSKKDDPTAPLGPKEPEVKPEKPGTLNVGDTGVVALHIAGVNSSASFLAENANANASAGAAGSLAIGTSLLGANGHAAPLGLVSVWPTAPLESITSGPPDGFRISIRRIMLEPVAGGAPVTVLDEPDGVTVSLESGAFDLSELIAAAGSTGEARFAVPVGSYARVMVEYLRRAEIKGCVSGNFTTSGNADAQAAGQHTYCTKAGLSTFDPVTPRPAEFEGLASAEWMAFDLSMGNGGSLQGDPTISDRYETPSPIEVVKDQSVELSMVIDLNRMLRFYNRGSLSQGPNPGMPTERAYFFTTIFTSSVYVFFGRPGRVYGYQMLAQACPAGAWNSTTFACTPQVGDLSEAFVGSWLTIVTAPDGHAIITSYMPDDDNALTVIKGSNRGISPFITAGSVPETATLHYGLDVEMGVLRDFPGDLEAAVPDEEIDGVTIDAQQVPDDGTPVREWLGKVYVRRKL